MSTDTDRAVETAASLYGVESAWVDASGRRRTADSDVVVEVLRRLGAPVAGEDDLADAARLRRRAIWERTCPPVRVCERGEAASVPLRVREERARGPLRWRLALEEGRLLLGEVRLEELNLAGGSSVDGRRYEVRRLELPAALPEGHHRLVLRHGAEEIRMPLIVGPARAFRSGGLDGGWGVFHPLFGLRDPEGERGGVADFGTLRKALRWTSGRGGRVFGVTPLHVLAPERPLDPSPYAPLSRLFWDDRFIELAAAPGYAEARSVGALRGLDELARHAADELVPWDALGRALGEALTELAGRFFAGGGEGIPEFRRFLDARPEASDFARFMAARRSLGADWRRWPAPAREGRLAEDSLDGAVVRRHLFGQWTVSRQLDALGEEEAALYLDIPLGSRPDGYDAWRHGRLFAAGVAAGAPPDEFFRGGQDWGLPPLHPERMRRDGYRYVSQVFRRTMAPARLVRVDHVMQLYRLFWIPDGARPEDGVYVRYPAEELATVLALESHRAGCEVVGEDLGTVPDAVRELMDRRAIRRTSVLGFSLERLADAGLPDVPAGAVATTGTHDMVPLAGLRDGVDLREGAAAGSARSDEARGLPGERAELFRRIDARFGVDEGVAEGVDVLLEPLLSEMGAGPAGLVVVPLDDLFGVREPQNVPGTGSGRPNWRRRLPAPLDGLPRGGERALDALIASRGERDARDDCDDPGERDVRRSAGGAAAS